MDCQVLITESAVADLKQIVQFVAEDSPTTALRLGEKLLDQALSLSRMPQRYPFHDASQGIRKMIALPYLIFYTHDPVAKTVTVLHFWHSARQKP